MKKILLICLLFLSVVPSWSQQNYFVFTQLKYDGNWDPYPEAWQDILEFMMTTTSLKCEPKRRVIEAGDSQLYASPFIVILGNAGFPRLSDEDRQRIRRYLSGGGMIFAENSSGIRSGDFDTAFRGELAKIFPEKKLAKLRPDNAVYRAFYLLRGVGGRRLTNNYLEGIDIAGRTALVYSQNDLIGAWAKDRMGNYLWECAPGGEAQRFEAEKLTQNILMYSVTGTYKSDAIHQPFIDQKLKR
jgi:hypothetical protein